MMNTYDYNGFDALDREEYDALMEDLAETDMENEMALEAAHDYFENELERDAAAHGEAVPTHRYQLVVIWDDLSVKTESCDSIDGVLGAIQIYILDNTCIHVVVYDWKEKRNIFDWNR